MNTLTHDFATKDRECWVVLVVDDEPDIHHVTRMLLADTVFSGKRIELCSAHSASEARAFLTQNSNTALILLDVVMESDHAGLELIDYIRRELGNNDTQIVLRTGQPGQAPEQKVIRDYQINGYFLKTEITAKKLNSIIISSLRAYQYIKALKSHHLNKDHTSPHLTFHEPVNQEPSSDGTVRAAPPLHIQPRIRMLDGTLSSLVVIPKQRYSNDASQFQPRLSGERLSDELALSFLENVYNTAVNALHVLTESGIEFPQSIRINVPLLLSALSNSDLRYHQISFIERDVTLATSLELDLPESLLPKLTTDEIDVLSRLRLRGISFSVSQFGTGITSLYLLRQLRPDRLIIDPRLVRDVSVNADSAAITRSAIALAQTLGIEIVAEGIDYQEQFELLRWENCEYGQGNFFYSDFPISRLRRFLSEYQTLTKQ